MASRSRKSRSRTGRSAASRRASSRPTGGMLPESAGWVAFLVLIVPLSLVGGLAMRPHYSEDATLFHQSMVALTLGTVLSGLLTYMLNLLLQSIARMRHKRR